jgi:hypothetical protein
MGICRLFLGCFRVLGSGNEIDGDEVQMNLYNWPFGDDRGVGMMEVQSWVTGGRDARVGENVRVRVEAGIRVRVSAGIRVRGMRASTRNASGHPHVKVRG